MSTEVVSTSDLLALARFRILDARNCNEEAKDRLLVIMADEIERLVKARDRDHEQAWMNGAAALRAQAEIERLQRILRDWGICGWERPAPDVAREHVESEHCWCKPTLDYTNSETGVKHWIHHEPN